MRAKILVLGSGSIEMIDPNGYERIYCANTSFTRLEHQTFPSLVISDALFFDEETLNKYPSIDGLSRKESNEFRLKKYNLLRNLDLKDISVFRSSENINIKKSIESRNINSKKVKIFDFKDLWKLYLEIFSLKLIVKKIFFRLNFINKTKFLIQFFLRLRMSTFFRPSLGVISIMLALKENPDGIIHINGINIYNDGVRVAKYEGVDKELTYLSNIHQLDSLYVEIIKQNRGLVVIED